MSELSKAFDDLHAGLASLVSDEDLRNAGYREYFPGYFVEDPRYSHTAEDRYLMDHPNPPKKIGKHPLRTLRVKSRGPAWDEEQFTGFDPNKEYEARRYLETRSPSPRVEDAAADVGGRTTDLWLCLVCRKTFALYPSEKAWRRTILGIRVRIVFRQPVACSNCRMFRQQSTRIEAYKKNGFFYRWVAEVSRLRRLLRW